LRTKNKTRPLFFLCFFLLAGLFAFNSYADEVTIDWKNGTYTGEVTNGVPNGEGIWKILGVGWYSGGFKNGELHGTGIQEYVDGTRYAGEYKNNTRSGQGWFMFGSGDFKGVSFIGEFKNDGFWNGTEYDKDFNVSATYTDGVRTEK